MAAWARCCERRAKASGHDVRRQAHVLLAAGDDDLGIAATNGLSTEDHRLEAGAADLVQGHGRHRMRQAGEQHALPSRVLPAACGKHLAEYHLVDQLACNAGAGEEFSDHRRAQLRGWNAAQRALEAADGSTAGGDYHDFTQKGSSSVGHGPTERGIN